MPPIVVSLLACGVMLSGALAGVVLRRALPDRHLNDHARDIVRLGAGLVGTIAALVLGLLINSASSAYEAQRGDVRQIAADLILVDGLLAQYGPQTRPIRAMLRDGVGQLVDQVWGGHDRPAGGRTPLSQASAGARAYAMIHDLEPATIAQKAIQAQALATMIHLSQARLMLYERSKSALPTPILVVLLFWLTALFASYCLFSPVNPTAAVALTLVAVSAAAALFLILEMGEPFSGLMQVSSNALRTALPPLDP
ncbi:MAG: DUF4239 domain-containing protein [Reyranella sp.]|nr:DUF4239 domain-containing protein [Reyranella sp.]